MSTTDDEAGFNAFVSGRFAALARTAYLLTGNHHDAEDLVQTALAKAARAWPRIRHRPEPYVRRILYNENISQWRKRRVSEHSTSEPNGRLPGHEGATDDLATKITLQRALAKLTPKQRTVLVLRYYEDLTEKQAAAAMGVSVGTIKSQTRHALMRLRQLAPDLVELVEAGH
ncbi:MAG: SigE family RNA polymerase sigma factor [Nocardioidaceae bacterium]